MRIRVSTRSASAKSATSPFANVRARYTACAVRVALQLHCCLQQCEEQYVRQDNRQQSPGGTQLARPPRPQEQRSQSTRRIQGATMDAANATILRLAAGTRVQNILGSSEGIIKPSAKQYWAKAIALQGVRAAWPACCSIRGCSNAATHGSHVKIRAHSTWGWYLIPACPRHNRGANNDVRACLAACPGVIVAPTRTQRQSTAACVRAGVCDQGHHVCSQGASKRACACTQLGAQLAVAQALVLLLLLLPVIRDQRARGPISLKFDHASKQSDGGTQLSSRVGMCTCSIAPSSDAMCRGA